MTMTQLATPAVLAAALIACSSAPTELQSPRNTAVSDAGDTTSAGLPAIVRVTGRVLGTSAAEPVAGSSDTLRHEPIPHARITVKRNILVNGQSAQEVAATLAADVADERSPRIVPAQLIRLTVERVDVALRRRRHLADRPEDVLVFTLELADRHLRHEHVAWRRLRPDRPHDDRITERIDDGLPGGAIGGAGRLAGGQREREEGGGMHGVSHLSSG